MTQSKLTPIEKAEYRFFYDAVRQVDFDLRHDIWIHGTVPRDWRALLADEGRPEKERVTLRLDADLVRFFRRKWGRGYQAEVNRVLRAFLKLHMAKLAKGENSLEAIIAGSKDDARPRYGEAEAKLKGDLLFGGYGMKAEE